MKFYLPLFLVLCAFQTFSQDLQSKIALAVSDKDTGSPISNVKVEVLKVHFGNASTTISERFPLGYTDECGYLDKLVPQNKARYSSHADIVENVYVLLFTHCLYGEFIKFFKMDEEFKYFEISKPFVYDLKAITDVTKTFIRFEWKVRLSYVPIYYDFPSQYPDFITSKGTVIWKGVNWSTVIFRTSVIENETITYTDYDVEKGNIYNYFINGTDDIRSVPGCPILQDQITIEFNDATPDTISFLPNVTPICPLILASDSINFGEVEISESKTLNVKILNIGQTPLEVYSILFPGELSSDFGGFVINPADSLLIPVTFSPTISKEYEDVIEVKSNALSGNSYISYKGMGRVITEAEPGFFINDLKVYPIPYKDILIIKFGSTATESVNVDISNSLGQKLFTSGNFQLLHPEYSINLKTLPPGFQILSIKYKGKSTTFRIIKLE